MDEAELDRIDMCHTKYCALIGKKRHLAPITDPQKILDLGCGTGPSYPGWESSWNTKLTGNRNLVY